MNDICGAVRKKRAFRQLWIALGIVLPLIILGTASVLANYIGPQRSWTSTEYHREYCNYRATSRPPAAFGVCNLTLYYSPGSCPGTGSVAGYFNNAATACGTSWPGTCGSSISCTISLQGSGDESCSAGEPGCTTVSVPHNDPAATVSGTPTCSQWGNAGWCRGTATLALSGSEPVAGHALTYFESNTNGSLCSAPSCTWTFPQGVTSMNYWVHSDYGDTSTYSTVSMSVDNIAPTLNINVPAPDGLNGWYKSNVTATASATDATSGVFGSPSINGGGSSINVTADGIYTLTINVLDVAGNVASTTTTVRRDSTPPAAGISMPAVPASGWFNSPLTITPSGMDAASGMASQQVSTDNITWAASLTISTSGVNTVYARFTDNAGNTSTTTRSVSVDVTAPTVNFNVPASDGSNGWYRSSVTVSASGTDAHSGVATQQVSIDNATWAGTVTVSGDGNHTVYARITDNAGNVANTTRTIGIDSIPPVTGFSLLAPDGTGGWYVHPVTVTPNGSDATSGVALQQVSLDNSTWSNSVTVTTNGTQTVYMRITDVAGNSASATRTIQLDTVAPTPGFSVPAPTGANGWYVSSVTITPNGSDVTSGVASELVSFNNIDWSPSVTVSSDGTYTVYTRITDNAGNAASATRTIHYDATNPVPGFSASITSPDGANGWYVHALTVTPNGSDATSGVASQEVSLNNVSWSPSVALSADGTYTVYTRVTDNAGNSASSSRVYRMDITQPTAGLSMAAPDGSNGWYVSAVTVTPTGSDATSGVASQQVSSDNATWLPSVTFSIDGNYTVFSRVVDNAGNSHTVSQAIHVDRTAPTAGITIPAPDGLAGWYVTAPTATPSGSDAASGIASQQVSSDNVSWSSSVTISADGTRTIYMHISDNAGNSSTTTRTIKVDRTAPITGLSLPAVDGANGWYVSPLTASPNGSDAASGVASEQVSLDNVTWSASVSISTDGVYTVYMWISDVAGNSASSSQAVRLDGTPPTANMTYPAADGLAGWYVNPVTITPTGSDATSGVASQEASFNGTTWYPAVTLAADGTYTVQARLIDMAGNATSISRNFRLDRTAPVITVTTLPPGSSGWYTTPPVFSVTATDPASGIDTSRYSVDGGDWQNTAPTISEGIHNLQARVTDVAGNVSTTSQTLKVDSVPPASAFISPAEGSTTTVHGTITLTGSTADATSGATNAEISLDNGAHWGPISLGAGGSWSYNWDTTKASDGTHVVLVRAYDLAGNQEHTARITVVVANKPVDVGITSLWTVWGHADVTINPGSSPVVQATITVHDPKSRWADLVVNYDSSNLPAVFTWTGKMGDGSVAYAGRYEVTVRAWDAYGNFDQATGWVIILLAPTPTPAPTEVPLTEIPPQATPTLLQIVFVPETPVPPVATPPVAVIETPAQPVKVVEKATIQRILWPVFGVIALLIVLASASLSDRRPQELRALAKTMEKVRKIQKSYSDKE